MQIIIQNELNWYNYIITINIDLAIYILVIKILNRLQITKCIKLDSCYINHTIIIINIIENIQMFEENFRVKECIWAKITGYPWWPARIIEININAQNKKQYKVLFFGDNSHAELSQDKIAKYHQNYQQYSSKAITIKRLKNSIDKADYYNTLSEELKLIPKINVIQDTKIPTKLKFQSEYQQQKDQLPNPRDYEFLKVSGRMSNRVLEKMRQENNIKQSIQLQQSNINEQNVISLLERSIVQELQKNKDKKKIKDIKFKLKECLLNKYNFKQTIQSKIDEQSQQIVKKPIRIDRRIRKYRKRNIQKKNMKSQMQIQKQEEQRNELKANTIRKIYKVLKNQQLQRQKSQELNNGIIEGIYREFYEFGDKSHNMAVKYGKLEYSFTLLNLYRQNGLKRISVTGLY